MSCTNPTAASRRRVRLPGALHETFRRTPATPEPDACRVVDAVIDAAGAGAEYGRAVADHAALVGFSVQFGRCA